MLGNPSEDTFHCEVLNCIIIAITVPFQFVNANLRVPHWTVLQYVTGQDLHLAHAIQRYLHGGNGARGIKPITPEGNNQREVQVSLCCCLVPREQQNE